MSEDHNTFELQYFKGIGPKTYARMKDRISVKDEFITVK